MKFTIALISTLSILGVSAGPLKARDGDDDEEGPKPKCRIEPNEGAFRVSFNATRGVDQRETLHYDLGGLGLAPNETCYMTSFAETTWGEHSVLEGLTLSSVKSEENNMAEIGPIVLKADDAVRSSGHAFPCGRYERMGFTFATNDSVRGNIMFPLIGDIISFLLAATSCYPDGAPQTL